MVRRIIFSSCSGMAKNRRKTGLDTKHSKGSYKKKPGPKPSSPGKRVNKRRKHLLGASHFASWESKIPKLIASLALERGESMDAGEARMALSIPPSRSLRRPRTSSSTWPVRRVKVYMLALSGRPN